MRFQSRGFASGQLPASDPCRDPVLLIFHSSAHLRLWSGRHRLGVVLLIVNLSAEIVFLFVQLILLALGLATAIFQPIGVLFTF